MPTTQCKENARFVRFIRAPHTSGYNFTDVREDAIITYALAYLRSVDFFAFDVQDFHLDRHLRFPDIIEGHVTDYVISIRETGANIHYARRIAKALIDAGASNVFLYGQVGRLRTPKLQMKGVRLVPHDESALAECLELPTYGRKYSDGLRAFPYIDKISLQPSVSWRRKASLESSRGCHFKCRFCFINHGVTYPTRWQLRPVDAIIEDVQTYRLENIRHVVFHDSEFLGADEEDFGRHRNLLERIRDDTPGTRFKIFARADTLERFGAFDLMQDAGLVQVFVGVESLSETNLRDLHKGLRVENIMTTIKELRDRNVHLNLSFMLFNRATTVASLWENIVKLKELAVHNARYLGMPNFLFSFEASWDDAPLHELSRRSYLQWMVWKREQPSKGVLFDVRLEPLAELCRLVHYELACKITELNATREEADSLSAIAIEEWFDTLWPFSVAVLETLLVEFEAGRLTMDRLGPYVEHIYAMLRHQNLQLPAYLQSMHTYAGHGEILARGVNVIPPEDHGWDAVIPGGTA